MEDRVAPLFPSFDTPPIHSSPGAVSRRCRIRDTFVAATGNRRSRRVKEKTGARLVRVEPDRFVNLAYSEREVWELTKAEWRSRDC
jgi:hypothetical protein